MGFLHVCETIIRTIIITNIITMKEMTNGSKILHSLNGILIAFRQVHLPTVSI